jgi:hypothetical protein
MAKTPPPQPPENHDAVALAELPPLIPEGMDYWEKGARPLSMPDGPLRRWMKRRRNRRAAERSAAE